MGGSIYRVTGVCPGVAGIQNGFGESRKEVTQVVLARNAARGYVRLEGTMRHCLEPLVYKNTGIPVFLKQTIEWDQEGLDSESKVASSSLSFVIGTFRSRWPLLHNSIQVHHADR